MIFQELFSFYNYSVTIIIMMVGLYIIITSPRRIKKLIGMSIFQVSVLLFYISVAFIEGGVAPIIHNNKATELTSDSSRPAIVYVNPLPHVLMLTAIVVSVATLAVGLALIILIDKANKAEKTSAADKLI